MKSARVELLASDRHSDEHLFVSGGHDNLIKMWDSRSMRTPLFDLKGHQDRVLCCDWGEPDVVASGGADNTMKTFVVHDHTTK